MPALLRKNTCKWLRANSHQATNTTLGGEEAPGAESDNDRALWFARAKAYLQRRNFLRRRPLEMGLSQSIHAITQG